MVDDVEQWAFVKSRGTSLEDGVNVSTLRAELRRNDLEDACTSIAVEDDIVSVSGQLRDAAVIEQIVLILGNIAGVSAVVADFPTDCAPRFYTVVPGDTLDRIAATWLGCASRANDILDANRPLLTCAQQIRYGLTLRLPQV